MVTVTPTPAVFSTTLTSTILTTLTLANVTDTLSITSTETDTADVTTTITSTSTTTETDSTTQTVTTATTPAGFLPVEDTLFHSDYPAGGSGRRKRESFPKRNTAASPLTGLPFAGNSSTFPAEVSCDVQPYVYETRIISATTTIDSTTTVFATQTTQDATATVHATLTAATPTMTSTVSITVTSTVTVGPLYVNATTTLSETTTTTSTITENPTTTETATTTLTFTSTTTANGACQTNNVINSFQLDGTTYTPNNLFNGGPNAASLFTSTTASDQFQCCDICSTTAGCTGSVFSSDDCLLLYSSTSATQCVQSQNSGCISYNEGDDGFYISNGLCGYIYYEGAPA